MPTDITDEDAATALAEAAMAEFGQVDTLVHNAFAIPPLVGLAEVDLDWAGFFPFSLEAGTYAAGLSDQVTPELAGERLTECGELQDAITARRRRDLIGQTVRALVDEPGVARSHREAPEIDGVIRIPSSVPAGEWVELMVMAAAVGSRVPPESQSVPAPRGLALPKLRVPPATVVAPLTVAVLASVRVPRPPSSASGPVTAPLIVVVLLTVSPAPVVVATAPLRVMLLLPP